MKDYKTVNEYILNAAFGKEILIVLREILLSTELQETIKWGGPVYTINTESNFVQDLILKIISK